MVWPHTDRRKNRSSTPKPCSARRPRSRSSTRKDAQGETYANIALIRPDKTGKAMTPSGKFKRVKDREQTNGASNAEYRRAEQANDPGDATDWRRTKVHIGKHKGLDVGDLDRAAVTALIQHWLPEVKTKAKPLADDRRLMRRSKRPRRRSTPRTTSRWTTSPTKGGPRP